MALVAGAGRRCTYTVCTYTNGRQLLSAHPLDARRRSVLLAKVVWDAYAEADGNGYGAITGRSDPLGRRLE